MTLSPDLKHTIAAHTAGMTVSERLVRAKALIGKYRIAKEDYSDVAFIACVREEDL